MELLICVSVLVVVVCIGGVAFSQHSKLRNCEEMLRQKEELFNVAELERAKLTERCSYLEEIEKKYTELSDKCLMLEKDRVLLATNLEQEKKNLAEKIKLLESAEQKLTDTFKALSSDALSKNNQSFIALAKSVFEQLQEKAKSDIAVSTKSVGELVTPIKTALTEVDNKLGELEKSRVGAYEALKQQVKDLIETQNSLKTETGHLVAALKNPAMRGLWGEMQLRRVVEIAGMTEHCDFEEQVSASNEDTNIRPDMVIYFPEGKNIVVDSKAPLSAYLEALNTKDERQKKELLNKHVQQIRKHVLALADKKYWAQFEHSPEFVVMFLPGEVFFSVAAEQDPELTEFALQKKVVISTPVSLVALLRTIALGWRNENLTKDAKKIIELGQELYKRLADMSKHISDLGRNIGSAVASYNQTVASLETRVLVSARKFKDLETQEKSITNLKEVENTVRQLKYSE
ncbi:MAG: DNA recombination protein RmuC [Alphaproteobacteria bacterium]|nr:DNA recombination protein RmuC [Alphaproteobacteria bacterium]